MTMGSLQAISFLQASRQSLPSLQQIDREPPKRSSEPFTLEKPHTCAHCETIQLFLEVTPREFPCPGCRHKEAVEAADADEYVCRRCRQPCQGPKRYELSYSATLEHTILGAIDAARSSCELFRWLVARTALNIPALAKRWETPEVMDAIVDHCCFEILGHSSTRDCVLNFWIVCSTAVSEDLEQGQTLLGTLRAWAPAGDSASRYILSRPYELDVTS